MPQPKTRKPTDYLRKTGRSTRMLNEAKRLNDAGRAVYVIANTESEAMRLSDQFKELTDQPTGVKFETPGTIRHFDWETLRPKGAHPNCVFLVDHFVIEQRFARILEMLHAFDSPQTTWQIND